MQSSILRNFTAILMLFTLVAKSQSSVQATYFSVQRGKEINLNLLENNKFEIVAFKGNYKVENDSIYLTTEINVINEFKLSFVFGKKKPSSTIKIKYESFTLGYDYLGIQNKKEPFVYKSVSSYIEEKKSNSESDYFEFTIDRANFIYLVSNKNDGKNKAEKYVIPENVSEINIQYIPVSYPVLGLKGKFDANTGELTLAENSGDKALVFVTNKEQYKEDKSMIKPIAYEEVDQSIFLNDATNYFTANDSVDVAPTDAALDVATDAKFDVELKIEKTLVEAIAVTKENPLKLLVVYVDLKNPNAKDDFDTFITGEEQILEQGLIDENLIVYNFYLASKDDEAWLKKNKINDKVRLVMVDGSGNVLGTSKSISPISGNFSFYDYMYSDLRSVSNKVNLNTALNEKNPNEDALLNSLFGCSSQALSETTVLDLKEIDFNEKKLNLVWSSIIKKHQDDKEPNMILVKIIESEIKNEGFNFSLFKKFKLLNNTDFSSIYYLIKHYEKINEFVSKDDSYGVSRVSNTLTVAFDNIKYSYDVTKTEPYNKSVLQVYENLISKGYGNKDAHQGYFAILHEEAEKSGNSANYLKIFNSFFESGLAKTNSPVEDLDYLFEQNEGSLSPANWDDYKEYYANLCNEAAWFVVEHKEAVKNIEKAVKWSEYSLKVRKNNPYYLDTLAQLYYLKGEKSKAIETQEKAVLYSVSMDDTTRAELKEVLNNMKSKN